MNQRSCLAFTIALLIAPLAHAQSQPVYFPNMQGTTGAIKTPFATTLPAGKGMLSVQESFMTDSLDRVHLTYGLSDRLEAGLRSDIPALSGPQLSLIVKFQAFKQDSLFRGMPTVGLGMNRGQFYFVSSYHWRQINTSVGWNKTKKVEGFFANASLTLLPQLTLQADISPQGKGAVLRSNLKNIWLSILFYDPIISNEPLEDLFWEVGYRLDHQTFTSQSY